MSIKSEIQEIKEQAQDILSDKHSLAWEMTTMLKKELFTKNIIIVILIILLVLTNVAWLIYESQFETETVTVDGGEGMTTYIDNSNTGDIKWEE